MAPYRILHVTRPMGGGMREHLLSLAAGLDNDRFRMLVAGPADPWLEPRLAALGVVSLPLDISPDFAPLADLRAARNLVNLVHDVGPSLLHCHGSKAALVGRLATGLAIRRPPAGLATRPLPVVYTVHGASAPNARWQARLARMAERALGWRTAVYVAVSEAVAAQVGCEWGVSGPRLRVIRNGIDVARFGFVDKGRARSGLGLPPGSPVVGTVARIGWEKGPDLFVRAAAGVTGRYPQALFVVAGDGPALGEVRRLAATCGLGGAIRFLGRRDDIPRVLSALDVFVLPSRSEGLPLALMEAMASGLPVVATAVGGVPEVIREGINGCLVPAGDCVALADRLQGLIGDPDLRARLGAAARLTAERQFDAGAMVRRVEDLYDEVLRPGAFFRRAGGRASR